MLDNLPSQGMRNLPEILTPYSQISPAEHGLTRMTAQPNVLFPEPDSPTSKGRGLSLVDVKRSIFYRFDCVIALAEK